jgi:hypothetical protein
MIDSWQRETFQDYQHKYESSTFVLQNALSALGVHVKQVTRFLEGATELPEIILKLTDVSVSILSGLFQASLFKFVHRVLTHVKDLLANLKVIKTVNSLVNFSFSWRMVILSVSGVTLFVISCVTLADRFQLSDGVPFRTALARIPIFGVLPFGGLFSLALTSLFVGLWLTAWERNRKLQPHLDRAKEKYQFWMQNKENWKAIESRVLKYDGKIALQQRKIPHYETLIKAGAQIKLSEPCTQRKGILIARDLAIKELKNKVKNEQTILNGLTVKQNEWKPLNGQMNENPPKQLITYQSAKQKKWLARIKRFQREGTGHRLSMLINTLRISKQIFAAFATLSGWGEYIHPLVLVLDGLDGSLGLRFYFIKREVRSIRLLA